MRPNQTSSSFFVSRVPPTTTNNAMFLPEHPNILEQTANPTSHLTNTPPHLPLSCRLFRRLGGGRAWDNSIAPG